MADIRTATEEDIDSLKTMWDEFMEYHRQIRKDAYTLADGAMDKIEQRFKTYIEANDKLVLVVCDDQENSTGFAVARVETSPGVFSVGDKARITDFYLRPEIRGQNVGTHLAQSIAEWAHNQGAEKIYMSIDAGNEAGEKFWKALGFTCTKKTYLADLSGFLDDAD